MVKARGRFVNRPYRRAGRLGPPCPVPRNAAQEGGHKIRPYVTKRPNNYTFIDAIPEFKQMVVSMEG